jgi:hypothetical protein
MSFLTDAIANTALSKLKSHMNDENISAYIARLDSNGEFTTEPIKGEFVILSKADFDEMKYQYFNLLHNGK